VERIFGSSKEVVPEEGTQLHEEVFQLNHVHGGTVLINNNNNNNNNNNKPGIVKKKKKKGTCMLREVAIAESRNMTTKVAKKILKY
jgi:hypothetical protein